VHDWDPLDLGDARRDQRAMAGFGVALDAEQGRGALRRHALDHGPDADGIENLLDVAPHVLGSELRARALADPKAATKVSAL
jgi:hypothetical protein